MRYIIVWRRSPTARLLDVQTDPQSGQIAVFDAVDGGEPVVSEEDDLIAYINGSDTDHRRVEAELAHRVLGWKV